MTTTATDTAARTSSPTTTSKPPAPTTGRGHADARSRVSRLIRWRPDDPAWVRPSLWALLLATAVLYLWGLGASGWANSFYSAAAQAGSESWKAFFFGSSDAASSITVDKTPLALWPMALAIRIFGLSSWSILVPQALEGVASVGLLYAVVRRVTGAPAAGLLAGVVLATTPVAVLMFRFNNPDALLVLLLIASVWATLRAIDSPRALRWVVLAGAFVGLAFLAKMLQAFLVLPALGVTYALFARSPIPRRIGHLVAALVSMIVAGGWWVAIVSLWPASDRPYIGGSQHNSILELTLGYNGLGRISGDETGSVGGMGGWGATGLTRMFGSEIGGQIAWLLPAALILGIAGLWFARSSRLGTRSRTAQAGLTVWLGWLLVTGLTFSLMAGIFHAYYTVALAPAVAALVGIGAWVLWRSRSSAPANVVLAFSVAMTAVLAYALLGRTSDFLPWLRYVVLTVGAVGAFMLGMLRALRGRVAALVAGIALVGVLAGPAAYAVETAATPHTGSIPSAGPSSGMGGMGGMGGPGGAGGPGGMPGGRTTGTPPGGTTTQNGTTQNGSSAGGLLQGSTSSAAVTALLKKDAGSYTWAAAAIGSNSAAGFQLASGESVMPVGGFNGSDPSPTLAQFKALVAAGRIHYFIASGSGGGMGGPGAGGASSGTITTWVGANFTKSTVDGVTLYDLTSPASGSSTGSAS